MNQLGDLLFSMPALKAAQKGGFAIYSVIKAPLAPLLESSDLIDGWINKDQSLLNLTKELKAHHFNQALLFSESPFSILSASLAGIKNKTGFESASLSFLLSKKAQKIGVPSFNNNKRLAAAAGFEILDDDYCGIVQIPQSAIDNVKKWFSSNDLEPALTIALSPGSSKKRQNKKLPNDIWAQTIDALDGEGLNIVLAGASYERQDLLSLAGLCRKPPHIFASKNILDMAAVLKICLLFLGTDGGAMHLAAAVGTKCAAIFLNTDPTQIGPMPLNKHLIIKSGLNEITYKDIVSAVFKCQRIAL
jgi:ADP-heptose:LPS heptosyltransferase